MLIRCSPGPAVTSCPAWPLLSLCTVHTRRPATVLDKGENFLEVEYDNGDK